MELTVGTFLSVDVCSMRQETAHTCLQLAQLKGLAHLTIMPLYYY